MIPVLLPVLYANTNNYHAATAHTHSGVAARALGELMDASHASCRDLYDCSCNELEALVAAAKVCSHCTPCTTLSMLHCIVLQRMTLPHDTALQQLFTCAHTANVDERRLSVFALIAICAMSRCVLLG
jgi:hypothetical protein